MLWIDILGGGSEGWGERPWKQRRGRRGDFDDDRVLPSNGFYFFPEKVFFSENSPIV